MIIPINTQQKFFYVVGIVLNLFFIGLALSNELFYDKNLNIMIQHTSAYNNTKLWFI